MSSGQAVIVGALIGGVFGFLGALIAARVTWRVSQRKRADVLFATALEFMGGLP